MTNPPQDSDWEEQAVKRYRARLKTFRDQLGPHASIVEVEELLIEHEHALMQDTLQALTEGVSPPRDKNNP
jgi:hypothetical protein